jgi:hypothetical protein
MAVDQVRASRTAAGFTVCGAIVAIAGSGLAFGPFVALAALGACLFLFGLILGARLPR